MSMDPDQVEDGSVEQVEQEVVELDESAEPAPPTPHQGFSRSLRLIADFYDAHPEISLPTISGMSIYGAGKDQLRLGAKAFGSAEKEFYSSYFILKKQFGSINLSYWSDRQEVCERREIGKKYVEAYTPPPVAAHEEPVYEWDCGSLFASTPDTPTVANTPLPDDDILF